MDTRLGDAVRAGTWTGSGSGSVREQRSRLLTEGRGAFSRPLLQARTDASWTSRNTISIVGSCKRRSPENAWAAICIRWTRSVAQPRRRYASDELLVYPYLKRTLLDIATVVFMGDEPGPQSDLMNKAFTDCLRAATAVVRFPVPGLRWSAGLRGRRALEEYFHTNIDARRASGGDDLFAALCRVRDEDGNQFTDDDVVNHMIFLMISRDRHQRGRRDGSLASVGAPPGVAGPGSRRVVG